MIVLTSSETRRLVGRLERGDRIPEAFHLLARTHGVRAGWIRALGALEWVELTEYDQAEQVYRPVVRIDAAVEILTLEGNLSQKEGAPFAHVHATVSRETPEGIVVAGGHLVSGKVFACEFVVECYDDVSLVRGPHDETGLSLFTEPDGQARGEPALASGEGASWARVADASTARGPHGASGSHTPWGEAAGKKKKGPRMEVKTPAFRPEPLPHRKRQKAEELLDGPYPEKGDYVEHRQFGLCRVDGDDAQGGIIIRLPSGVRKTINLDFLRVLPPRWDGERRIFPLEARRRGSPGR